MVDASDSVEWIVTETEVAALLLEYSLIKEHLPRFNIRLRDDKSYPYLAITRSDQWPRARVMRGAHKKGNPILWSVRACLRDPQHARSAAQIPTDTHVF